MPELPPRAVGRDTVCYDMAYGRGDTAFMRWATERGSQHAHKGWGMLIEQAAESYLLWHYHGIDACGSSAPSSACRGRRLARVEG